MSERSSLGAASAEQMETRFSESFATDHAAAAAMPSQPAHGTKDEKSPEGGDKNSPGSQIAQDKSSEERVYQESHSPSKIEEQETQPARVRRGFHLRPATFLHYPLFNPDLWCRLSADQWFWEIAAIIISIISLACVCIVLAMFDGKPAPNLPYSITLNSAVSFLGTLTRSSLLLVITVVIGQSKWLWLRAGARIADISAFEDASRGPLGSLLLLMSPGRSLIVRLGTFMTILLLGLEPFIQQLIVYPIKHFASPSERTLLRVIDPTQYISNAMPEFQGFSDFGYLDIESAVMAAILDTVSKPMWSPSCRTGSCTWPEFYSLGACSQCVDVTDEVGWADAGNFTSAHQIFQQVATDAFESKLHANCSKIPGNYADNCSYSDYYSVFNARNYSFPHGLSAETTTRFSGMGIVKDGSLPFSLFTSVRATRKVIWALNISTASLKSTDDEEDQSNDFFAFAVNKFTETWTNFVQSHPQAPLVALGYLELDFIDNGTLAVVKKALDCSLELCVRKFSAKVDGGRLLAESITTDTGKFSVDGEDDLLYSTFKLNHTPITIEVTGTAKIAEILFKSMLGTVNSEYNREIAVTKTNDTSYAVGEPIDWDRGPDAFSSPEMFRIDRSTDFPTVLANVANSITTVFNRFGTHEIIGKVLVPETVLQVRWAWITFPIALVVLGVITLAITIYESRGGRIVVWKDSSLPLLYRGPYQQPHLPHDFTSSNSLSSMVKNATNTQVRLKRRDESGMWVLGQEQLPSLREKKDG